MSRGRKSAAATEVTVMLPGAGRPEPPAELDPIEARCWRDVVDALPGGWIDLAGQLLLRRLACQTAFVERLEQQMRDLLADPAADDERLAIMAGMHRQTSKSVAFLLGQLRATPKSRALSRDAATAFTPSHREPSVRPWDIRDSDETIQ